MQEVSYIDGYAYVDGYKFRKDNKSGYYLCTRQIDGSRPRLHVYMWESRRGDVPKGDEIHHSDENKDNNEIDNLVCMTRKEHLAWHAERISDEQRRISIENLEKARDKASAWHKSEEGREWHREHSAKYLNHDKRFTLTCSNCGKEYKSAREWSKFCSSNCQTKHRYKTGIDNETRVCEICGNDFIVNKYLRTKTCSKDCKSKLRNKTMRAT